MRAVEGGGAGQVGSVTGGSGRGRMCSVKGLTADEGLLARIFYLLTLAFVAGGVAGARVVAWFHGERGKQQTNVLEWMLLSVIGGIWVTVSAWILLAG